MLTGIDRVPWAELTHAYGSAEDVPGLLQALTSDDADQRSDAIDDLYGNIWHQGTVYQATSHAVPFLIEIVSDPSLEDRAAVLELLYAIAYGSSYLDVHQHLDSLMGRTEEPDFEQRLASELADVRRAKDAVVGGLPRYLALLDDREQDVRLRAAKVLSACGSAAGDVVPQLIERARATSDPPLRASILFALAELDADRALPLLEAALESEAAIVRLAAALASSRLQGTPLSARVEAVLVQHLTDLDAVDYDLFPFGENQASDIATALAHAEAAVRMTFAEALLEEAELRGAALSSAIGPLLALAFGGPLQEPTLASLEPVQRRTLELVARYAWEHRREGWMTSVDLVHWLRAYGLEQLGQEVAGYCATSASR